MLITNPHVAKDFILAGRAYFTIKSLATGEHYTYKVTRTRSEEERWFVSVLTQPETYTYMGLMYPDGLKLTRKSTYNDDSKPVRAFRWFMSYVMNGELPQKAEFRHEGKCGMCARPLTHPESIDRGIGPECNKRLECS